MPITQLVGPSTGVFDDEVGQSIGTVSIANLGPSGQDWSYLSNPTGTNRGYVAVVRPNATGNLGSADDHGLSMVPLYATFYFYPVVLPASASEEFCGSAGITLSGVGRLRLTSAGLIAVYNSSTVLQGTGSDPVLVNQWNRLDLYHLGHGTPANTHMTVKLNGVTQYDGVCATGGVTEFWGVLLGKINNRNGNGITVYYSKIVLGNDASAWVVDPYVIAPLMPRTDGAYDNWVGATSDLREIPWDDTSYIRSTVSGSVRSVLPDALSSLGPAGTIYGLKTFAAMRSETFPTGSVQLLSISAATELLTDTIGLPGGLSYAHLEQVFATDFGRGNIAWSEGTVNACEAGMKALSTIATRCTQGGLVVLYEPVENPPTPGDAGVKAAAIPARFDVQGRMLLRGPGTPGDQHNFRLDEPCPTKIFQLFNLGVSEVHTPMVGGYLPPSTYRLVGLQAQRPVYLAMNGASGSYRIRCDGFFLGTVDTELFQVENQDSAETDNVVREVLIFQPRSS